MCLESTSLCKPCSSPGQCSSQQPAEHSMMSTSRWCGNANKAWLILRTTTDSVAHICLDFRQHGQQVLSWIQMTMHGCDSQPSQAETLEGPMWHTLHGLPLQAECGSMGRRRRSSGAGATPPGGLAACLRPPAGPGGHSDHPTPQGCVLQAPSACLLLLPSSRKTKQETRCRHAMKQVVST